MRRLEALGAAATGEARALVMSAETLLCRQMPRARFLQNVIEVTPDMRVEPTELVARLVEAGYERTALVEARGQCALRGGHTRRLPRGHAPRPCDWSFSTTRWTLCAPSTS